MLANQTEHLHFQQRRETEQPKPHGYFLQIAASDDASNVTTDADKDLLPLCKQKKRFVAVTVSQYLILSKFIAAFSNDPILSSRASHSLPTTP